MKYIYQHLGLGDHIVCNGLIRVLQRQFGDVTLYCKTHNFDSVSFMFRDNKSISILPLPNDVDVVQHINNNNLRPNLVKIGHDFLNSYNGQCSFDESFYRQFNINFEERWSSFFVERDSLRENNLFSHFNVKEGQYIFIHDDNRFQIDTNKIKNKLPIIRVDPKLTPIIFDYVKLIENAAEFHTIESSFQFINDSMLLNNNTYVHRYPRVLPDFELPKYRNVKEIFS